jgi:hypothetical protein
MNNFKKLIGASVLACGFALPAQADMVLDTFTYYDNGGVQMMYGPNDYFDLDADFNNTFVGYSVSGAGVTYSLNAAQVGPNNANVNNFGGVLSYNNDNGVASDNLISYFGAPAGLDFSALGESFYFDVIESDGGFSVNITLQDAADRFVSSSFNVVNEIDNPTTLFLSFASFMGDAAFDWTIVKNVFADVSTGANVAIDLSLDEVGIVPAPGSIALLGLGLLGLGLRSRKNAA